MNNQNNQNNQNIYGYLRVSTKDQDLDKDKAEILLKANKLGLNGNIIWIEEKISGSKHFTKRELGKVINQAKEEDIILTTEISRIGRKGLDVSEFISICSQKKIKLYLTRADFAVNDSINSQTMVFAYSISAQIERELLIERTKAGLKKAVSEGKVLGRPKNSFKLTLDSQINNIKKDMDRGTKIGVIAKKYGVSHNTMTTFIKRHKLKNYDKKNDNKEDLDTQYYEK